MKYVSYIHPRTRMNRGAILTENKVIDLQYALQIGLDKEQNEGAPSSVLDYLHNQSTWEPILREGFRKISETSAENEAEAIFSVTEVKLTAPLPRPSSVRDFYAFEQHVQTCRKKRGLDMVEQWYDMPVFYFSNHQAIIGPEDSVVFPKRSLKRDFELEVGIVIGKEGRDITREEAFEYVFGLTILNDWSARDIQAEEVKVGLGPAKAKDFATSIGPSIVTMEEWGDRREGEHIDLTMEAYRNGQLISEGNLKNLYWSIPQLIERASQDCSLYPGDILGTGTVGTGCLLEHVSPQWLTSGDELELKVERLGVLKNYVQ